MNRAMSASSKSSLCSLFRSDALHNCVPEIHLTREEKRIVMKEKAIGVPDILLHEERDRREEMGEVF
ncbi:hypothetical protein HanOQP8_Chr12g0462821 [Helianthus annuus]|nr:hypothetical protein HanLR1_Chr12g0463591 [Helianthus annuus]KAJ0679719.1 hypothetical protein HanOQP8_Chr12g0462821 [Helianthus annuus]